MENKLFRFAIVIPHYNSSQLLKRMINSIPERDDIQIFVVDDCSNQHEKDKLRDICHKHLEIVYLKENGGAGFARNEGLKRVQSKWVTFVDSDDMFAENAFDVLDKYVDSEYDYICYCVKTIKAGNMEPLNRTLKSEKSVRSYLKNPNLKTENLLKYMNNVCWNKMVSVDFLKQHDIRFECSKVNNDVLYALQIGYFSSSRLVLSDELYVWIENVNSLTRKQRSIEKEFAFFLQAQKRNGFYQRIGLDRFPYYRSNFLYLLYYLRKRGVKDTMKIIKFYFNHKKDVIEARNCYIKFFEGKL